MSELQPTQPTESPDDPDPLSLIPIVPIRGDIDVSSPASNETVEAIIEDVRALTPPLEEGEIETLLFRRRRTMLIKNVGKLVLSQRQVFNPNKISYIQDLYEEIKNQNIVSVDIHPDTIKDTSGKKIQPPAENYSVDYTDGSYVVNKSSLTYLDVNIITEAGVEVTKVPHVQHGILDESAAKALLAMIQSLKSE